MRIVFDDSTLSRDLDVAIDDMTATVADVLTPILAPADSEPTLVWVDGRSVAIGTSLPEARLRDGSVVSLRPGPDSVRDLGSEWELVEAAGLSSGQRYPLPIGRSVVGRSVEAATIVVADHAVAPVHAAIDVDAEGRVRVEPVGPDPVVVDGAVISEAVALPPGAVLELGPVALQVMARPRNDRPLAVDAGADSSLASVTPFNRPPRATRSDEATRVDLPKPPGKAADKPPFNLLVMALPALSGVGLYLVTRSPLYLMFMLMSPLMQLGNVIESRRRSKLSLRKDNRRFAADLDELRDNLSQAARDEQERRAEAAPPLPEVLRRCAVPSSRLWERRPWHRDFLCARLGAGATAWAPPVHGDARHPEIREVLEPWRSLERAVAVVSLRPPRHGAESSEAEAIHPFGQGGAVGVAGDRSAALAVARSLVLQAATHQGPVDVQIALFVNETTARDWDWAKWLPHCLDPEGQAQLAAIGPADGAELAQALLRARLGPDGDTSPEAAGVLLAVVDDPELLRGRRAPVRRLLNHLEWCSGVVLTERPDQLPSMVATIVDCGTPEEAFVNPGRVTVRRPAEDEEVCIVAAGVALDHAREGARALARFEDPELHLAGAGLPDVIRLPSLLAVDLDHASGEDLLRSWLDRRWDGSTLEAPLGGSEDGVFDLDLVRDGPHGLIGGTTGSGKSELLRSFVIGLAIRFSPDEVNLVLGDYKGGGSFDVFAETRDGDGTVVRAGLPHCVGYFDDLDAASAERVLQSLNAELRQRERWFQEAHVDSFVGYRDAGGPVLLPRLVVIVDEFAKMGQDLPEDFLDTLIDIAERGRSLGVHLILAAQRPSQAINDRIRANTNLRIALRVQDRGDSDDVIGSPVAASIGRRQTGRAYVRLGQDEMIPIQAAWSTAPRQTAEQRDRVTVRPFRLGRLGEPLTAGANAGPTASNGHEPPAHVDGRQNRNGVGRVDDRNGDGQPPGGDDGGGDTPRQDDPSRTELHDLVDLTIQAYEAGRREGQLTEPRRPMLAPLDDRLTLSNVDSACAGAQPDERPGVAFLLADDPDQQAQYPERWEPRAGNLLVYGIAGAGVSTTLRTIAAAMAVMHGPDDLHVYGLDYDGGSLRPLAELPHTGAVVGAGESERLFGLARLLQNEVARRRAPDADPASWCPWLFVVDGYGSMAEELRNGSVAEQRLLDQFHRVFLDGPGVGVHSVLSAGRSGAIPSSIASLVRQRLLMRLADRDEYSMLMGRVRTLPDFPAGGGFWAETGRTVQVARADDESWERATAWPAPERRPRPVGTLPSEIAPEAVADAARFGTDSTPWFVPLGLGGSDLEPAGLEVYPAEHVLVAGAARSGKSTALAQVARLLGAARVPFVVIASPRSPLAGQSLGLGVFAPEELQQALVKLPKGSPCALLVDDAEIVADPDGQLAELLLDRSLPLRAFVTGTADRLRRDALHWSRNVRLSRTGLLLDPSELDATMFEVQLPTHHPVPVSRLRGFLVQNGAVRDLVQLVTPWAETGGSTTADGDRSVSSAPLGMPSTDDDDLHEVQ